MSVALQHWAKSEEGLQVIGGNSVFCLQGTLYQGWKGHPITVDESQLTDEELDDVLDVDQSIAKVWFRRRQRLESRSLRKVQEIDKRRNALRDERSKIRQSIKEDKELGLNPNPDDTAQIGRIDERMLQLNELNNEESLRLAKLRDSSVTQPSHGDSPKTFSEAEPERLPERLTCDECGEPSPPGHSNPKAWRTGHMMGKHKKRAKKAS